MHTNPARSDQERIRAFHQRLDQPSIVEIDEATAYWLEDADGQRIGDESTTSEAPLLAALAEIRRGVDPIRLYLLCNAPDEGAPDDGRYVITTGDFLVEFAESAAGIPARPRMHVGGELSGRSGHRSLTRPGTREAASAQAAQPASGPRPQKGP